MINDDSKIYKLYISHLNEDNEEYKLFISKLNESYDFQWKDYAIQGETLPDKLDEQMESVDVIIILSGLYVKYKELIQSQIDAAVRLGKPIVVIRPYGIENIPSNLEEISTTVVGWSTSCIIDSIKEALGEDSEY